MKYALLMAFLFASAAFQAAGGLPPWGATEYLNGIEICERHKPERANEHPLWIPVPINYKNSRLGTFPLYAWTTTPFDPKKKSLIFVDGGPGNTSHFSSIKLEDWNVVLFDQRGNSCSRPPTLDLYLSRSFYSSENTARDIDEIRKFLKLEKISVYGVSYGTIPAHLYGALFENQTRALVLEGNIFQSDHETLIENPRRRKLLQRFFNSLPERTQNRILELSQRPDIPNHWFANAGKMMLYLDDPFSGFASFLENVIWNEENVALTISSFEEQDIQDIEFGFSPVMMNMLACKELGMNTPGASFSFVFHGRNLVPENTDSLRIKHCQPLGFSEDEKQTIFKASDHPIKIPVTYYQGTLDGATSAFQAVKSFKHAALGSSHLVLVKNGGHMPMYGPLNSGYEDASVSEIRKKILNLSLEGAPIPSNLKKELTQATGLKWIAVSK